MKKQSTLFIGTGLSAAPADHDFVLDGLYAGLAVSFFDLTGTAPTVQVTATALYEDGFDLDYDAQTANFTVGAELRGVESNAKAVIVADADGGATGTLTLKRLTGSFKDNEPIVDDAGGAAVVNGIAVRRFVEDDQVWADTTAVAVDTLVQLQNPDMSANEGDRGRVWPRRFRLKFTFGGTVTNADFAVDLLQSEVK